MCTRAKGIKEKGLVAWEKSMQKKHAMFSKVKLCVMGHVILCLIVSSSFKPHQRESPYPAEALLDSLLLLLNQLLTLCLTYQCIYTFAITVPLTLPVSPSSILFNCGITSSWHGAQWMNSIAWMKVSKSLCRWSLNNIMLLNIVSLEHWWDAVET